jgi:hypothetical protein
MLGGLIVLGFVLHEVQGAVQALIFAWDWPSEIAIRRTANGLVAVRDKPLDWRARLTMAGYRMAQGSLFCHEVHSYRMRRAPMFRTIPSMAFGALVFLVSYAMGQSIELSSSLAVCTAAAAFLSSQTRSFMQFHQSRSTEDAQLHALLKGSSIPSA